MHGSHAVGRPWTLISRAPLAALLLAQAAYSAGEAVKKDLVPLASAPGQELLHHSRADDCNTLSKFRVSSDEPRGGAAAAAMALNALSGRDEYKPASLLTPAAEEVVAAEQVGKRGFTLHELAAVMHTVGLVSTEPKFASDRKYEHGCPEFLKDLEMVSGEARYLMLVNYARAAIDGAGTGQAVFSAVGAYSAKNEMVLILSGEAKEEAFWVQARALYAAMNVPDEVSGRHLGWIVVAKPYPFLKEDLAKHELRDFGDQKPIALQTPEGQALLDEKKAVDYRPLKNVWVPQLKSHCAACTAVMVLNALQPGTHYNQYTLFQERTDKILTQDVVFHQGFTLEQMANFIPLRSGLKAEYFHAGSGAGRYGQAAFVEALKKNRRSADDFMMVNMKGHFSPVGDYNEEKDMILILEVSSSRPSYWISSRGMFDSMNTVDSICGKTRGWILVHR
jgi:hypothetical protein